MYSSISASENIGMYSFYNMYAGLFLSYHEKNLILSAKAFPWTFRQMDENRYYICAGESGLIFDIENACVSEGTTVKLQYLTGYDVQIWSLLKNVNGTYSVVYSGDNRYCLGYDRGRTVLQLRNSENKSQQWRLTKLADAPAESYLSKESRSGIVKLRLPPNILNVISEARLQVWANNLETAYFSLCDFTSYRPYKCIVVEAYKSQKYAGWVICNSNTIHVDKDFIYTDLEKMTQRNDDWNFCLLHEMGHMFDNCRAWDFEGEMMTDLKVAYVLEKHNASAAPAEFSAVTVFRGADIIQAYKKLGKDFSVTYDIFSCTERFLKIKQQIGWDCFRKTFHHMQLKASDYCGYNRLQRFIAFTDLLSYYSNKDIKSYFSTGEWNAILKKCNGR